MDPRTGLLLTGTAPVPSGILGGIGISSAPTVLPRRPECTKGMGAGSNLAFAWLVAAEIGGSAAQAVSTGISTTRQKRRGLVRISMRSQHIWGPLQTQLCLDLTRRTLPRDLQHAQRAGCRALNDVRAPPAPSIASPVHDTTPPRPAASRSNPHCPQPSAASAAPKPSLDRRRR